MSAISASAGPATRFGLQRWFTGLTVKGLGLILLICVLNAVRRTIQGNGPDAVGAHAFVNWLIQTGLLTRNALIIALPVTLAVVAAWNLAPPRPAVRYAIVALALLISSALSITASVAVEYAGCVPSHTCEEAGWRSDLVGAWVRYGLLCALFTVVFVYLRIAEESTLRSQQAEVDRARFVQRMEEARLRMLQAQIEPHFLFNTLANVRRLYQTAPTDGAAMLDHLMRYLAVALPHMRAADSTLDREAELTRSYLEIQRLRMGHRLRFAIDIPEALRAAPLPPMMLVTLTENAIKHGLAPLPEGGHVAISAASDGTELTVRVADSGRGFTQSSGGGTGLANIRARLAAMYGGAGRLSLALNQPRGVVATIAVPVSPSVAA
ncbi:MAG TPA: histidine kinase [Rhodanobacteraceae bacterium]